MIQIIHASALDVNADMLAACDVLVCDPPYAEHVHSNATSVGMHNSRSVRPRELGFASLTAELRVHIARAAQSVRRWSCIFSDVESTHVWREACAGAEYIRAIPWVRWSQPQLSGDRPPTGCEMVSVFHARAPGRKHWNGPGSLTHLARRCLRGEDKHPTEKPIDLMLDLVSWFSDPSETVLDLCAGAGTTALAARLLERDAVAIEIDPTWAERAQRRIDAPLSERDMARVAEWCITTHAEASAVPAPTGKHDVRTWERAQRRLADVARAARNAA